VRRWIAALCVVACVSCAKTHQLTDTSNTAYGLASENSSLGTFITMLETSHMDETLRGTEQFTVLAPTNRALAALGPERVRFLMSSEGAEELDRVVKSYVFPGDYSAEDVARGKLPRSLAGTHVEGSKASDGTARIQKNVKIIESMKASNGFVHVINAVLP
jgi:uncharacterized surface protein with fasciclin (FAS1) repeats